jgi:hypothetical protein
MPADDSAVSSAPTPAGRAAGPQVRLALGWRARQVEQQSTAPVRFHDDDYSAVIAEDGSVALAYADPAHAFVLPPGRYLRVDQAAGRVYVASASPQLDVVGPEEAVALADSVARLLEGAGWARVPGEGAGARAAVATAAAASDPGAGTATVGVWRVARSAEPWGALPPDPNLRRHVQPGVQAVLTVRPMKRRAGADGAPRLLLTLRLSDDQLGRTLNAMVEARRARHGGKKQTLAGWDGEPEEALVAAGPR